MTTTEDELLKLVKGWAGEERWETYLPETEPLATFWRQASEGTFYWRLLIPARKLPGRISHPDSRLDPMERQSGDTAIWQFLGDLSRTAYAAHIQDAGVRCLMELDDNYLIPPPNIPGANRPWRLRIRESWERGESGYSHEAHRLILPSLDGLIVSTDVLANAYEPLVRTPITVCPNSVEPDDWEPVERTDRNVTVGYAGGDAHLHDLSLVEQAVDWAYRDGASLVKLGAKTREWPFPHEQVAWTESHTEYRRSLQKIDIGLCPLKRGRWQDCKSDIKCMEYLMAGALPIVQGDSPVYADWVGVVPSASTPKEWTRVVREVVALTPDERLAEWERAHAWLLEHKTIDKHIASWRRAIR